MSEFQGVTVVKKANVYFNGNVTSRTVIFPGGSKNTLGIMQPGQYGFTTSDKEIMEIISGSLQVQVGSDPSWRQIRSGESFDVPADTKFTMRVAELTDYCCSFIK